MQAQAAETDSGRALYPPAHSPHAAFYQIAPMLDSGLCVLD